MELRLRALEAEQRPELAGKAWRHPRGRRTIAQSARRLHRALLLRALLLQLLLLLVEQYLEAALDRGGLGHLDAELAGRAKVEDTGEALLALPRLLELGRKRVSNCAH